MEVSPPIEVDRRILEVLEAPLEWGETVDAAFRRKERALLELFASLSSVEASKLHHRLSVARPDDAVASCFARLVPERRARLLAFLAEAPRRAAITKARRA